MFGSSEAGHLTRGPLAKTLDLHFGEHVHRAPPMPARTALAFCVAPIEFDGIYGEGDHWLPSDETDAAVAEAESIPALRRQKPESDIPDLDQYRSQ